jgi:D-alanyl-D-alanine carboxypeptidase
MYSTIEDLAIWAASTSGGALISEDLAAARLETTDIGDGLNYGLGIMVLGEGTWLGHEGDAIGWETLALYNPETGATFVAAANTCGAVSLDLLGLLGTVYPF